MAQGQIRDPDLIDSNIRDGVEILGVVGDYVQSALTDGEYFLGPPVVGYDLGSSGIVDPSGLILFYDDGTDIVIFGESSLYILGGGAPQYSATVYFCKINKATGVLTRLASQFFTLGTTTDYSAPKLAFIGGEYYFSRTNSEISVGYYKFDGTDILKSYTYRTAINAASNIGSVAMAYNGKTLSNGGLRREGIYSNAGSGGFAVTSGGNIITILYS